MKIFSDFDGGNIEVIEGDNPENIRLNIRKDNASDFYQWFSFGVSGVKGKSLWVEIENAGQSAFPDGWKDYRVCLSYDQDTWVRTKAHYEDGVLSFNHTSSHAKIYFAYFAPFSMKRHKSLIAGAKALPGVSHTKLGKTPDGHDFDLLTVGKPAADKKNLWVIARQHPGETMAEWWMEGFLGRLLDEGDAQATALREKAVFYIVPNMNPDGSVRGNLRTNAMGANLNREWGVATAQKSPEVLWVTQAMEKTGVDFMLDVHGDESLPYNFIAGAEGVPGFTAEDQKLLDRFLTAYKKATPAFQTQYGYVKNAPGTANLTLATNYVAHAHKCLAMTLEMPFKDDANHPDEMFGWSAERSAQLGHDAVEAILSVVDKL